MLDLLIWLAANGSGHKIAGKTDNAFLLTFLVLFFLIGVSSLYKKFLTKEKK